MRIFAGDNGLTNLGLISQLVEIKYGCEAYLSKALTNEQISAVEKETAIKNYNAVRIQVDRIVYQLSADMLSNNSIRKYRRLEKYYKNQKLSESESAKKCINSYTQAIEKIYQTYKDRIQTGVGESTKSIFDLGSVADVADVGWEVIADIHQMKGQKVDGVIEILNNLRLDQPSEQLKLVLN